ncbi:MAG: hypothetical protein JSV44_12570 [Candidatus Zixiibacteriota bacterium]|nr:MAG: hypothetical protein JSV44_12570 [candidate division Zixibacteria bacterium]
MIQTRIMPLALFMLLAGFMKANSEELLPHGSNRFVTRKSEVITDFKQGNLVIVQSAVSLSGKLYITGHSAGSGVFEYRKMIKAAKESRAHDYAALINVTMEQTPEGLKLMLQAPNPPPWSGAKQSAVIEGELRIPFDCELDIRAGYFDIVVEGPFKAVSNLSSYGRLEVNQITEQILLATSGQDIIARQISGDIALETSNGEIRIVNMIVGEKQAFLRSQNGNIIIDHCVGGADIKASYGKVKATNAVFNSARIHIDGSYSPIELGITSLDNAVITAVNINEDIEITLPDTASVHFLLEVDADSEINVEGILLRPVFVDDRRLEFISGEGKAEITAEVTGIGDIMVEGMP